MLLINTQEKFASETILNISKIELINICKNLLNRIPIPVSRKMTFNDLCLKMLRIF